MINEPPPLRGILLRLHDAPDPIPDVLPVRMVEHGWYPCAVAGVLRFAFQGLEDDSALGMAVPPHLPTSGYRVWKKGQQTFAIMSRTVSEGDNAWDERICKFLQQNTE